MSTPQDPPTRKKQKMLATRKLELWRKKQAAAGETASKAAPAKTAAPAKKK